VEDSTATSESGLGGLGEELAGVDWMDVGCDDWGLSLFVVLTAANIKRAKLVQNGESTPTPQTSTAAIEGTKSHTKFLNSLPGSRVH